MQKLSAYLLAHGNLTQPQLDLILQKAKVLQLKTGDYYSEAGKVARKFGFIIEGVIRVFNDNAEGEELTKYFIDDTNIVVDLNSFDNNTPSTANLQAITDCKIIAFTKQDWEDLLKTVDDLDGIIRKIISKASHFKMVRLSALVSQDATTRYLNFLEHYPNLVNRIPLSYVASYLGITQSSLSRIRKSIC